MYFVHPHHSSAENFLYVHIYESTSVIRLAMVGDEGPHTGICSSLFVVSAVPEEVGDLYSF